MIDHYAYRQPLIFLFKNETKNDIKSALQLGDVETTRDYMEILFFGFDNEIILEHFGNSRSLLIKGCSARFFVNPNDVEARKQ